MTKEQKEQTVGLLFAEKCSCVVRNGDEVRIFRERGVKDLYRLLREEPQLLDGAFVADKVVACTTASIHHRPKKLMNLVNNFLKATILKH